MELSETPKTLTAGRWAMLALSISVHAALLMSVPSPEADIPLSLGALSAPAGVNVSFALSSPAPEPVPEQMPPETKPEPKPEPELKKPEPKPKPKAEPVLKKKAVPKKPAPKKPEPSKPKKVEPKPQPSEVAPQLSAQQQKQTTGLADAVEVITKPVFRKKPAPLPYPKMARRRNQQGRVLVEAGINRAGDPFDLKIVQSSGYPLLDKAALRWVEGLAFMPLTKEQQTRPVKVHMPVVFALQSKRR